MKTFLLSAALAASLLTPAAANAQAVPAAVIAVVDLDRVTTECNACKTAAATLRAQLTSLQNRRNALAGPIQTEAQSLQTAVTALNGKDPDAALQARIKAFQQRQQTASNELQNSEQQLERNTAYVRQQIGTKLGPIYKSVMQRRGANVMLEAGSTLAATNSVDVTNDVLAGLNASLTTISTTAPAQQQPQGR
jgi:outer membrane protein